MPLLERRAELALIERTIEAAAAGRGGALVLRGPAGIGKTRLLRAAGQLAAARGMYTLSARPGPLDAALPWGVARELLAAALPDAPAPPALLAGQVLTADGAGVQAEDAHSTAMFAIQDLVEALAARQPLLLLVDDLHWSDVASARWVDHLAARVAGRPIALIAAARRGECADASAVIDELYGRDGLVLHTPPALSRAAVHDLVEDAFGSRASADLARACLEATGGNPLLLRALIDELASEDAGQGELVARVRDITPDSVREETARRLAREAEAVQRIASAAAILGDGAGIDEVAAVADLAVPDAVDAADRLVSLEILARGPELAFVHPLIGSAVLETVPEHRRRAAHARAARVLDDLGAPPERVAAQIVAAAPGRDAWAVDVLHSAAALALARGAPDSAVTYLERALAEPPENARRGEILYLLGLALLRSRPDVAVERLRAALDATTMVSARAQVAIHLALALVHTDRFADADVVLGNVGDELGPNERELSLGVEAIRAGVSQQSVALRAGGLARLRALAPEVAEGRTPAERLVLAQVAAASPMGDETAEVAAGRARRALGDGALLAEVTSDSPSLWYAGSGLLFAEALGDCEELASAALEDARRRGSRIGMSLALWFRAAAAQRRGALEQAVEDGRASLDLTHGSGPGIFFALEVVCAAEIARGRASEALALLERYLSAGPGEATFSNAIALHSRGMLRHALGESVQAAADIEASTRVFAGLDYGPWVLPWRSEAAVVLAAIGRIEEGRQLVARELELASRWGAPRALGIALRGCGLLRRPADVELLEQSAAELARSSDRAEHARTLLDLGASLRRAGQRAAAAERLRAGLTASLATGASGIAAEIRTELAVAGTKPQRAVHRDQELTASELRVAELAAQRLTNREIADALFVAVRTVETHLTHAYTKLGVTGRRELAVALRPVATTAGQAPREPLWPRAESPRH